MEITTTFEIEEQEIVDVVERFLSNDWQPEDLFADLIGNMDIGPILEGPIEDAVSDAMQELDVPNNLTDRLEELETRNSLDADDVEARLTKLEETNRRLTYALSLFLGPVVGQAAS